MLTSKDIITKRDNLSETITRNWDIIKSENVVFRGYKRNYDMKLVLDNILTLCKERIEVKLQSLALNLDSKILTIFLRIIIMLQSML